MSYHDDDVALLANLNRRETKVADAAARVAYERAGAWLTSKQTKSQQFPGGDLVHAKGREDAYRNAAQTMYMWAIEHGERV